MSWAVVRSCLSHPALEPRGIAEGAGNPQVKVYDGRALATESTGQFDILTGASAGEPHYWVVRGNATGVTPPALFEGIPADLQGGIAVGALTAARTKDSGGLIYARVRPSCG
jgi:hypothetical protein